MIVVTTLICIYIGSFGAAVFSWSNLTPEYELFHDTMALRYTIIGLGAVVVVAGLCLKARSVMRGRREYDPASPKQLPL